MGIVKAYHCRRISLLMAEPQSLFEIGPTVSEVELCPSLVALMFPSKEEIWSRLEELVGKEKADVLVIPTPGQPTMLLSLGAVDLVSRVSKMFSLFSFFLFEARYYNCFVVSMSQSSYTPDGFQVTWGLSLRSRPHATRPVRAVAKPDRPIMRGRSERRRSASGRRISDGSGRGESARWRRSDRTSSPQPMMRGTSAATPHSSTRLPWRTSSPWVSPR